jgi:ubiquinone/menaquinone biosynthesis C-methylase UbiE
MDISTAITLIKKGVTGSSLGQVWADLGAGTGLFTKALSTLLPEGSTIYAVDKDRTAVEGIVIPSNKVILKKTILNFLNDPLEIEHLDGILMANALHFVNNKFAFFKKITQCLNPSAKIVIIEYDREKSNAWVPYPISYRSLELLANDLQAGSIEKIGSTPSKYHEANIYSALLTFR